MTEKNINFLTNNDDKYIRTLNKIQNIINTLDRQNANKKTEMAIKNIEVLNKILNDNIRVNNFYKYITYNNDFNDIVYKCLKKIDNIKYQEYINLSTNILKDDYLKKMELLKKYDLFISNKIVALEEETEDYELLTSQINAIPKYLSFAYANNSKISLEEAYEKSMIKEIADLGQEIIIKLMDINKLYFLENGSDIHVEKSEEFTLLALFIKEIADSKNKFDKLISLLFKGIYEFTCTSKNNSLYDLAKKYNVESYGLDLIKWYRTLEQHSIDKTDIKKEKNIYEFNSKIINKKIPEKPSDFVKLQHALYKEILEMLSSIFKNLNS